jgi:hypothetical protein
MATAGGRFFTTHPENPGLVEKLAAVLAAALVTLFATGFDGHHSGGSPFWRVRIRTQPTVTAGHPSLSAGTAMSGAISKALVRSVHGRYLLHKR